MLTADINIFFELFRQLMKAYPSYKLTEPDFRAVSMRYWRELRSYEHDDLAHVFAIAPGPDYFPTTIPEVAQLKQLIQSVQTKRKTRDNRLATEEKEKAENDRILGRYAAIPADMYSRRAYLDEAGDEYERLAREMEIETIDSGRDPTKEAPEHIGKARLKQIKELWREDDPGQQQPAGEDRQGESNGDQRIIQGRPDSTDDGTGQGEQDEDR